MKRRLLSVIDSNLFVGLVIFSLVPFFVFIAVPMLTFHPGRQEVAAEAVEQVQVAVPPEEKQSVIVYGDSRAAFLGEGTPLVPGWSPVVNAAREGCAFLGQDRIFRQYGSDAAISERTTSEQTDGTTLICDTRTYITGNEPHYDIAIVYAGTLLTVNNGTTSDVSSPVEGFMNPADTVGQWSYLLHNLTETLERINADTVVVLATPISTSTWEGLNEPFWDDVDRIMAVNSMLFTASNRTGAFYLEDFAAWVEAQPEACHPDGSHFTVECAVQASNWIKAQLP